MASNSGKVLQLSQRKRMAKANAQASSTFQSKVKSSLFARIITQINSNILDLFETNYFLIHNYSRNIIHFNQYLHWGFIFHFIFVLCWGIIFDFHRSIMSNSKICSRSFINRKWSSMSNGPRKIITDIFLLLKCNNKNFSQTMW